MGYHALSVLFDPLRERQRRGAVGFARPVLIEHEVTSDSGPWLSMTMRGGFLPSKRSSGGWVRFAFAHTPLEEEDVVLNTLYRSVAEIACVGSVSAGVALVNEARVVVVGESGLTRCGVPDNELPMARERMRLKGYVARIGGLFVVVGDLPDRAALVVGPPHHAGVYARIGDHVGILVTRVGRSIVAVHDEDPPDSAVVGPCGNDGTREPGAPPTGP